MRQNDLKELFVQKPEKRGIFWKIEKKTKEIGKFIGYECQ